MIYSQKGNESCYLEREIKALEEFIMKKKLTALALSALLLTGCAPSTEPVPFDCFGVVEGQCKNGVITTPYGHNWKVENISDYTGPVEVTIDAMGTEDVSDDMIMFIVINAE